MGRDDERDAIDGLRLVVDGMDFSALVGFQTSECTKIVFVEDEHAATFDFLIAAIGVDNVIESVLVDTGDFEVSGIGKGFAVVGEDALEGVGGSCAAEDLFGDFLAKGNVDSFDDFALVVGGREFFEFLGDFSVGGDFDLGDGEVTEGRFCGCVGFALSSESASAVGFHEGFLVGFATL